MSEKDELRAQITRLPDHSDEEIRIAADQLKNLEYSFNLGNIDIDLFEMRKEGVLREIDRIDSYSFQKLVETKNLEPAYKEGEDKEEWSEMAKTSRIRLIVQAFTLLSRLRSDEPEAWDEVNELYFDD